MNQRRTLVVFGDDWGRHVSTLQHVVSRLLPDSYVIWIESVGLRQPGFTRRDLRRARGKLAALLWGALRSPERGGSTPDGTARPDAVIPPRVLPWHRNAVAARFNRWSLRRTVRRALAKAPNGAPVVLVSALPTTAGVVGGCGEAASIYFCMDDYATMPDTSPEVVVPLERELIRRVDTVVATAARLVELKRPPSGRAHQLPQGCNYEHFATPRAMPEVLRALPRPIVGFAGGFAGGGGQALDVPTLRALAERHPEWSLVLVGPLDALRQPLALPNVHFIGAVPYAELPAYVQAFDVGIVPYVENDWTRSVDPLKLLEYLAAGAAVVASPIPEVHKYRDVVRIAPLGDPFVAAVEQALREHGDATRAAGRAVAARNTWEHRAARFRAIIDETLSAKGVALTPTAVPAIGTAAATNTGGARRLAKGLATVFALAVVRPMRDAIRAARRRHPVRIFTWHRVMDGCDDPLTVSPATFRAQLRYLVRTHDIVPLPEALRLVQSRTRLRRPVAAITFDDGYRSVSAVARPVMEELRVVGCSFVCTDYVGTDRRFEHDAGHPQRTRFDVMDWGELAALRDAGWTIGGHTATHARLAACDRDRLQRELGPPLATLRECLGAHDLPFAYPFGGALDVTLKARHAVRDAGYTACFSNHGGENFPGDDPYWLRRIDLGANFEERIWKARAHGIDLARWRDLWRPR